jgi:hypothetical protein
MSPALGVVRELGQIPPKFAFILFASVPKAKKGKIN